MGGRKSHYTIGRNADVTVTDLPRVTDVQRQLNLGVTDGMQMELRRRRSNVVAFLYEDMTKSALRDASFDLVLAVEVLEHVHEDDRFVREACRVLRPGGAFIMSTPNGDFVANHNPDHVRHYRRAQLDTLLEAASTRWQCGTRSPGGSRESSGCEVVGAETAAHYPQYGRKRH